MNVLGINCDTKVVRYLQSNNIVSFNKNALIGLINLEKVCLFSNPISSF